MKKVLLASTVALSMACVAKTTVYAEESQATNKVQTSEKATGSQAGNDNLNQPQNKSETVDSKASQKQETTISKEQSSTEVVNKEGWKKENNQWRYYENNQPVSNWKKIAGIWYYFNQEGIMLSNTFFNDYILNNSGALAESSWVKIDDQWYYATEDGKVTRNTWKKIAGVWYRFGESGTMLSNAIYNDYLLKSSGAMAENAWVKIEDKWYYATVSGKIIRDKWEKISSSWYYFNKDGVMLSNHWKDNYYLKDSGTMAENEWVFDKKYDSWFYLKSDGSYAQNQWVGSYYLKSGGYMAKNEWIFDKDYDAWYYLKEDGSYVTGGFNIKNKEYFFQSDGKWIQSPKYFKVKPITAYIYSESGDILSYVNQGSIVNYDSSKTKGNRLAVSISGLSGYMNQSDLTLVDEGSEFIPHYTTDGRFLYHELSPYASIRVAPHSSAMTIGKKYYSADGINFDNFTVENPFLFRDLSKPTNYTAAELDKIFSIMNIQGSRLAGKGAIFKEAEERYKINALYLIAHSALESSWGRSQIAKDKNNFFGIAAYDTSPYDSAKSFDNVDKGILGAAKWIRENYYNEGKTYLGNKASGMNVLYASDPYWGEKIASIMMRINSQLGEKD